MKTSVPGDLVILAVGLFAVARPGLISRRGNAAREERLEQLKAGEKETFFEERRQIEAYPFRQRTVRLLGALVVALALVQLFVAISG